MNLLVSPWLLTNLPTAFARALDSPSGSGLMRVGWVKPWMAISLTLPIFETLLKKDFKFLKFSALIHDASKPK